MSLLEVRKPASEHRIEFLDDGFQATTARAAGFLADLTPKRLAAFRADPASSCLKPITQKFRIQEEFSGYYLADELGAVYRGMLIAVPAPEWIIFRDMSSEHFVDLLIDLARKVNMRRFKKHPRKAKKKQPPRKKNSGQPHVSTARILAKRGSKKSGSTS
jgi:hypothetical protein